MYKTTTTTEQKTLLFWAKSVQDIPAFVIVCTADGIINPLDYDCV